MNRANHSLSSRTVISPRELAAAIGVSESSVKRWVDGRKINSIRTAGGHRRIKISEAVRFIRETGSAVEDPTILGLSRVRPESSSEGGVSDRLFGLLERGAGQEASSLLINLYLGGHSIADLLDGPIHDSLARLGEIYLKDGKGILIEHRATAILASALHQLHSLLPTRKSPVAVGGALSGDPYIIPTLAAACVLAAEGFKAVNLGPDTPIDSLRSGALEWGARIVWISSTSDPSDASGSEIPNLVEAMRVSGGVVVVGGRSSSRLGLTPASNLIIGGTMAQLAALGKGILSIEKDR